MLKQHIERLVHKALKQLEAKGELIAIPAFIPIIENKDKRFGDLTTNIALTVASSLKMDTLNLAQNIIAHLATSPYIAKVEMSETGLIHFHLALYAFHAVIEEILKEGEKYGRSKMGQAKKVLVEVVSANPRGLLQISEGRHAIFGTALSNLLDAVGFETYKEYYVNDTGPHMDMLTLSIWLQYLKLNQINISLPDFLYQDAYIINIAQQLIKKYDLLFAVQDDLSLLHNILKDNQFNDSIQQLNALTLVAKELLGEHYQTICKVGLNIVLKDIKTDLTDFGVDFDNWFSESDYVTPAILQNLLKRIDQNGYIYSNSEGCWLCSTALGDYFDRLLIDRTGKATYFFRDMAYHLNKFERGFDMLLDIFRLDYQGYMPGMKAAIEATNINPERLLYLLVEKVEDQAHIMPTTLQGLREVFADDDALRFFYLMYPYEKIIFIDQEVLSEKKMHAYQQIKSVYQDLTQINFNPSNGLKQLKCLNNDKEKEIIEILANYPEFILQAALQYEPSFLIHYISDLTIKINEYMIHYFYPVREPPLHDARGVLLSAARQILYNSFNLLGMTQLIAKVNNAARKSAK